MTAKAKKGVDALVEEIGNLSVLELSDLVKVLQDKFGVSAAAPVQVIAQGGGEAAQQKEEEKSEFTVTMTSCGDKKEAKDIIDNLPGPIKESVAKEEAQNMKSKLEEVGAAVELK